MIQRYILGIIIASETNINAIIKHRFERKSYINNTKKLIYDSYSKAT